MKIGFEAKRAFYNKTGLGNYSRTIIDNYHRQFVHDQLYLFTPKTPILGWPDFSDSMHLQTCKLGKPFHSLWKTHLQSFKANRLNLDIYHGLSNELPHFLDHKIKKIVTIHDTIFYRFPEWYPLLDRASYFYKTQHAIKKADQIIAISQMTANDLIQFFGADPKKIHVVYQTCHQNFYLKYSEEEKKQIRQKYNLPEKFILNVGTIEPRKNALKIIEALHLMKDKIHLVIVGKGKEYKKIVENQISQFKMGHQVTILDKVEFQDLPKLYQSSSLFLYPSHFEGFGIPIIEAIFSEIPIIAAKGSCLEEAGGKAGIYINPHSENEIKDAIEWLLYHPTKYNELKLATLNQKKKFEPSQLSQRLRNIYLI
jgi:glycosyltransferase involved in cell wall biosynthesis